MSLSPHLSLGESRWPLDPMRHDAPNVSRFSIDTQHIEDLRRRHSYSDLQQHPLPSLTWANSPRSDTAWDRDRGNYHRPRRPREYRGPYTVQERPSPTWSDAYRHPDPEKQRYPQPSCCKHCQVDIDRRRRNKALIAGFIVVLLYLFGNMVFLNVRVVRLSSKGSQLLALPPLTTTSANASNPNALATDAQTCLSQFAVNAPSSPMAYPCSSCLTSLQNVPQSFAVANPADGQRIMNAIQFCGLRSLYENANDDGQSGLSNGGWGKDVRFCAWSGVRCDGNGRVSSIKLTFPAVPAKIPDELKALAGLTSLQITGDTNIPAGTVPTSLQSLNALTTLYLESTALTSIPPTLLKALTKLTTIVLVKNAQMSSDFILGLTSLSLANLVINGQPVQNSPIPALLANAAGKTVRYLELSGTSLKGSLPADLSFFTSLVELHMDNNALVQPLPNKFPPGLQVLSLKNNTQLTGSVAPNTSFCSLTQLKTCDIRGSGLSAGGACGVCQFQ